MPLNCRLLYAQPCEGDATKDVQYVQEENLRSLNTLNSGNNIFLTMQTHFKN